MTSDYLALVVVYGGVVLLIGCLLASLYDDDAKYRNPENPPPTPRRHIPLGVAFSDRERIDAKRARKWSRRRVEQQKQAAPQREQAALSRDSFAKAVRGCLNKLRR